MDAEYSTLSHAVITLISRLQEHFATITEQVTAVAYRLDSLEYHY